MSATVYITRGGEKYHYDQHCYLLTGAQELNDVDCWGCYDGQPCHGPHRQIHPTASVSADRAALQGKLPCLHCVPESLKMFAVHDFGHQPTTGFADPLGRGLGLICARCRTRETGCTLDAFEGPMRWVRHRSVRWPCTSAIVLGLVSRGRGELPAHRGKDGQGR